MEDKDLKKARENAKKVLHVLSGLSFKVAKHTLWHAGHLLDEAQSEAIFDCKDSKED